MQDSPYYGSEIAQAIVETTTEPFLVLDRQLVVQQANSAFLAAFQVERHETDGYPLRKLGNGQWDIPELLSLMGEVLNQGAPVRNYKVQHTFERIGTRTMLISARPLLLGEPNDRLLVAISDITESERLRLTVEGQKEFAEKIVDASRDPLLILDTDLRVKTANETFYWHFKVDAAATEGQLVYDLGNGQWNIPQLRELLEDVLPDNNAFNDFHVEHDFAEIGHRVMLLNARRVDHLQLILLAIEDITERQQQQTALKASEERLRKVLETDAVGVIFFDHSGTIIDCNESFLKMTGYSRSDVQTRALSWQRLTPPESVKASEEQMEFLSRTGRIGPYEKQYIRRDGARAWMIFAGRDLGDGTIVEFCVDISDRKMAEEQRELLARELSHRVKNILAVVQSLAIQTAATAPSVDDFRSAFLGRLQALSRAQALIIDSHCQAADIRRLVEEALQPYREAGSTAIHVEGDSVVLDGRKTVGLILVLHELATNAVKYGALSQPGGRLSLTWRQTTIGDCHVEMVWHERDGPACKAPSAQGFGSRLIERATQMELGGKAELDYNYSGLICRLSFPVA